MSREVVFSEGRGLRARKYGPDGGRGIAWLSWANEGLVAKRTNAPVKRERCPRACGARPSARGGERGGDRLAGWRAVTRRGKNFGGRCQSRYLSRRIQTWER